MMKNIKEAEIKGGKYLDKELDFTHFAVNKVSKLIVNGWNYSGYDSEDLRIDRKYYFDQDLDEMGFNPKEYKYLSFNACLKQGIDPNENSCWSNDGHTPLPTKKNQPQQLPESKKVSKIVRLTEADLHNMIKQCINELGASRHGYVPSDGNSMTGGRWGYQSGIDGQCEIDFTDIFAEYAYSAGIDDERGEDFLDYFEAEYGGTDITLEGEFTYEYDDSVGIAPGYNVDNITIDQTALDIIQNADETLLSNEEKDGVIQALNTAVDNIDIDLFNLEHD